MIRFGAIQATKVGRIAGKTGAPLWVRETLSRERRRPCFARFTRVKAESSDDQKATDTMGAVERSVKDGRGDMETWRWSETDDAVATYAAFAIVLALGNVSQIQSMSQSGLIYFISLAVITIYMGAHRGLSSKERARITLNSALAAPLLASVSLFGFFLLIKYLPDLDFQTLLNGYFFLLATFATLGALSGPLKFIANKTQSQVTFNVPIPASFNAVDPESNEKVDSLPLYGSDVVVMLLALCLACADLATNHQNFTLSNLIACLIASDILQLIGLSSFRVAGVLLIGMSLTGSCSA